MAIVIDGREYGHEKTEGLVGKPVLVDLQTVEQVVVL
jgi:hypothetical protein